MKRALPLILLALLVISWITTIQGLGKEQEEYLMHMERAAEYEAKQIYVDALTEYEAALSYTQNPYEIQLKIMDTYLALGKKADFADYGERLLTEYHYPEEVIKKLVDYQLERDNKEKAIELLTAALKVKPDNAWCTDKLTSLKGTYKDTFLGGEFVGKFYGKYAPFKDEGMWGLIDTEGKKVTGQIYDEILPYSRDGRYAPVKLNSEWFFVDQNGYRKLVPDENVESLGIFGEGYAAYQIGGSYGYLDEKMNIAAKPQWQEAGTFAKNLAPVKKDGKWALIDTNFQLVTDYIYEDIIRNAYGESTRFGVYMAKLNGTYHVYDLFGNQLGSAGFEDAKAFESEGPAAVKVGKHWGFVGMDGEMVIKPQYEDARSSSRQLAPVLSDDLWGYIDMDNQIRIEPKFTYADTFTEDGKALVKDRSWRLIRLVQ